MKLHSIIAPLSENDDDMFPGVASSVFDDTKAKDQQPLSVPSLSKKVAMFWKMVEMYEKQREQLLKKLFDDNGLRHVGKGNEPAPHEILYSSFDWFDEVAGNGIYGISGSNAIDKSSPALKDVKKTVAAAKRLTDKEDMYREKIDAIEKKIVRIENGFDVT
jgi:hypothetical protein